METGLVNQSTTLSSQIGSPQPGRAILPRLGSASRRAEYLLVVYPYGELQEKLQEEQQQFSTDYGLQMTVRNRPHITLAAFQAGEPMEDTLIRWIQRICNRYESFDLTLNNFSGFPPHTIYLRVQDPQPFRELIRQLKAIDDFVRSSGCPPVNLIGRPYLSIAGGLTEQVYNKAMPDYSRKTFHDTFHVDQLVLLKREHAFDACKTVNIFRLLPATDVATAAH
ncbi:2'-5' RNA ligase family protein [Puia sp.]|jgi:2'-5' RNA ligase|uniref:2'-5' RNA ligase family protein n=1 Tax=Puia sp. TaxID=2045100 RepID=UPI002F42DAA8